MRTVSSERWVVGRGWGWHWSWVAVYVSRDERVRRWIVRDAKSDHQRMDDREEEEAGGERRN